MKPIAPVTLERDGVRLEPLARTHVSELRDAAADGELWKLWFTSVPEPEATEAYVEAALRGQADGHMLPFVVRLDGRVVGSTRYHDIVARADRVEIGYTWYARSVQRTALDTTCKLLLMSHAFDALACRVVGWRTDVHNVRSQRAIERLGAKRDGVIRHHAPRRDGSVRDTVMYGLLADEWPAVREKLEKRLAEGGGPLRDASVALVPMAKEHLSAVLRMNPGPLGERMVASNAITLAQAMFEPGAVLRVVVSGDRPVGLVAMLDPTVGAADGVAPNVVYVWRLLIDLQAQGGGIGSAAMREVIAYARSRPGITEVRLTHMPSPGNPGPFYERLGFRATGRIEDGEVEVALPLGGG